LCTHKILLFFRGECGRSNDARCHKAPPWTKQQKNTWRKKRKENWENIWITKWLSGINFRLLTRLSCRFMWVCVCAYMMTMIMLVFLFFFTQSSMDGWTNKWNGNVDGKYETNFSIFGFCFVWVWYFSLLENLMADLVGLGTFWVINGVFWGWMSMLHGLYYKSAQKWHVTHDYWHNST